MGIFQTGNFELHGGSISRWKIECDNLTIADMRTIAMMMVDFLPKFDSVEGVPFGGLTLSSLLWNYTTPGCETLLICDDVLTTDKSMEELRNGRDAVGTVIFARGQCPSWVTPLFQMPRPRTS